MATRKEVRTLLENLGVDPWLMDEAIENVEKLFGELSKPEFKDGDHVSITRVEDGSTAFHWAGTVYTGSDGDLVFSLPFGGGEFALGYFTDDTPSLYTVEKVEEA